MGSGAALSRWAPKTASNVILSEANAPPHSAGKGWATPRKEGDQQALINVPCVVAASKR